MSHTNRNLTGRWRPLLYFPAMFSRVLVATTFIIVLASFASAWITLDVLAYAGVS